MAVSITSIEAFKTITKDGTRMTQKEIVHDAIKNLWSNMGFLAPTRREVAKFTGIEISACTARINELMHDCKIVQMPKRKCTTTGKKVFPVVSIAHRKDAVERLISRCLDDISNLVIYDGMWNDETGIEVKFLTDYMGSEFQNYSESLSHKNVIRFGYWNQIPSEMLKHIENVTNIRMAEFKIKGRKWNNRNNIEYKYAYFIEW
jgi:hypothetical protein